MRTFMVARRLIKQIGGDKRSIALLFIAPIFVLYLMNIILTSGAAKPNIDIVSAPNTFVKSLEKEANTTVVTNENQAITDLKNRKADAYIIFSGNTPKVTIEGADPAITKLVMGTLNKVLSENMTEGMSTVMKFISTAAAKMPQGAAPQINLPQKPEINYLYGSKDMVMFDSLAPLLMGFFIFFFVFLIAGVSFLRERISGTLDRILATPLKRSEIVWGYFFGFGIFVALQTMVIQLVIVYGLKVVMVGSFWAVLFINLLLAAGSLSLGTLLSAFAANEFQLFQFIPIVIIPQILFSGIFDLRGAPMWVTTLSKIFPLTYGAEALRNVMIRGGGIGDVLKDIIILAAYAILFVILNILALKKYRKI